MDKIEKILKKIDRIVFNMREDEKRRAEKEVERWEKKGLTTRS